jgi:hypothetical protein
MLLSKRSCVVLLLAASLAACSDAPDRVGSDASTTDAATPLPDAASFDASIADAEPEADADDSTEADADLSNAADAGPFIHFTSDWKVSEGLPSADCTAWDLSDTADPENPVITGGHLSLATGDDGDFMFYGQTIVMTPELLVIEARVRVAASASTLPARSAIALMFRLGEPKRKNLLQLEDGKVFLLTDDGTRGPEAAVPTTDAVHLYRMEVNMATKAIRVFQDGVHVLDGAAYVDPSALPEGVFFGDLSGAAHGASEWLQVRHNAYLATFCPGS